LHLGIAFSLFDVPPPHSSYKPRLGTSFYTERGQLGV